MAEQPSIHIASLSVSSSAGSACETPLYCLPYPIDQEPSAKPTGHFSSTQSPHGL